jgi:chromosomal replication initiator protein
VDEQIPQDIRSAWEKTLSSIEKAIRPQYFQSFILTIRLLHFKNEVLTLGFLDKFTRDWVFDHYSAFIQEKFDEASGQHFKLEFTIEPKMSAGSIDPIRQRLPLSANLESARKTPTVLPTTAPSKASSKNLAATQVLNPKYSFETFVVGSSNQFAHAAAFTVAEAPGKQYNPLFIYGDVGLGKTHLMNSIGLKIQEKFPHLRVHYTTFEKFMNHMIESIRFERMEEFRERYRKNCDVLVIDDIQFIAGKEATQEEFFHTFNALYEHQKQIVISSDRPPIEIEKLEDRLRSRFEMGLTVDIQAPEMETRVAIVFKKAEIDGIDLPNDVAFHLAKMYRSNIRELEGALIKLSAYASLTGQDINLDLAKKVLKQDLPDIQGQYQRDPEEILKLVSREFQVSVPDLKSDKKNRQLAVPRQLAMFLCRKYTHLSLPDIGTLFGGKNHTTVLHADRKVKQLQSTDPKIKELVHKLESHFQPSDMSA